MKFRKINDNKFQCILYQEDMKNFNVTIEDFLHSDPEKIHELLETVVEEAYEQIGVDVAGSMMSLQLVPQPNHSLLLTVSSRQEDALPDFLKPVTGEEMSGFIVPEEEIPTADEIVDKALSIPVVFRFEGMQDVERFCSVSKRTRGIESMLIKGEDGGYYMMINRKSCSEHVFVSFIANILEYSDIYTSKELEIDYIMEHGTVLVEKNAVNTIKKYCS